jgi:hypothetical protein
MTFLPETPERRLPLEVLVLMIRLAEMVGPGVEASCERGESTSQESRRRF